MTNPKQRAPEAPPLHWLGIAIAVIFWLVESIIHSAFLGDSAIGSILPNEANEIWMRSVIALLIVAFGFFARRSAAEHQRITQAFEGVLDSGGDGYICLSRDWALRRINQRARALLQIGDEAEIIGRNLWDLSPEATSFLYKQLHRCMESSQCPQFEAFYSATNSWFLIFPARNPEGLSFHFRDISEQKRREAALFESHKRLHSIVESAGDGIITISSKGLVETYNHAAEGIFGYPADEVIGRNVSMLMCPYDAERHDGYVRSYIHTGVSKIIDIGPREVNARRKDGSLFPMDLAISEMRIGDDLHFIGIVRDITERKRAQEQLEFMSNFDPLTGLPNRALLRDRMEHAIKQAHRDGHLVALMFLDLDRFKTINDSLGHSAGDQLLKTVAGRLADCVREGDTIARLGGDEFVVLLEGIHHVDNAALVADKIRNTLAAPIDLQGNEVVVTASIGITVYPFDDERIEELLKDADTAMYRAKEGGRDNYQFFTADMTAHAVERMQMEQDLRKALERDELVLYYQPQIDLGTRRVSGMEALLRWNHPEKGLVSPAQFIPILEETGLILQVGEWVIRTAVNQCRTWIDEGVGAYRIAVNLSARQFRQSNLFEQIETAITEVGLDPQLLELEITEGLLVENIDATVATLDRLNAMGLQVSIDDFGTGYSSLNYLKRLPLDTLKIDQSFIRDITTDADDAAIAQAIIGLAGSLRLKVIAEGVETMEQLAFLQNEGCQEVQGYLFCRPQPPGELATWLTENRHGLPQLKAG